MGDELQDLIKAFAKLPGMGPRSGRRAVLHLLKNRHNLMRPLIEGLDNTFNLIKSCDICANLDVQNPCKICSDPKRDETTICVLEDVSDLWAIERTGTYRGKYHVLGGTLSALEGVGPEDLTIPLLLARCRNNRVEEIILALNSTMDGQTTSHYIQQQLIDVGIDHISSLARGVPIGGELDYLDDGTLITAINSRRKVA